MEPSAAMEQGNTWSLCMREQEELSSEPHSEGPRSIACDCRVAPIGASGDEIRGDGGLFEDLRRKCLPLLVGPHTLGSLLCPLTPAPLSWPASKPNRIVFSSFVLPKRFDCESDGGHLIAPRTVLLVLRTEDTDLL